MNNDDALYLLGLEGTVDASSVRHAYERRRLECEQKISTASTEGLKQKYHTTLSDLDQAYRLLVGTNTSQLTSLRSANTSAPYGNASTGGTLLRAEVEPHAPANGLTIGYVLAKRYEIRRVLGEGGMGAVYEAFDRLKQESVAIKVLLPQYLSSVQGRDRFMHEAKIACRLSHPNIVKVFDVALDEPYHFITMELLSGETLRQEMEARKANRDPVSVKQFQSYAEQLIAALEYAHKQIVHRDLKPENVWICPDGTLKLIDFGIARAFTKSALTRTGMVMGTAYYMAPEQFNGAKDVDWRADQYSLGVILYELLAGRIPQGTFVATRELRKDVPMAVSRALMTALAPEPSSRFASLAEFGAALASRDAGLTMQPKSWVWGAAAAAAIVGLGGVWTLGGFSFKTSQPEQQVQQPPESSTEPSSTVPSQPAFSAAPVEAVAVAQPSSPPAAAVANTQTAATSSAAAALEGEVLALLKRLQERERAVNSAVDQQAQLYNRAVAEVNAANSSAARKSAETQAQAVANELQVRHDLQQELQPVFSEKRWSAISGQIHAGQMALQANDKDRAVAQFSAARTALLAAGQLANDIEGFVQARAVYFDAKRQWVEFSALRAGGAAPSNKAIPAIEAGIQPAVARGEYARLATTVLPGLTAMYSSALRDARRPDTRSDSRSDSQRGEPASSEASAAPPATQAIAVVAEPASAAESPRPTAPAAGNPNAPKLSRKQQAIADRTIAQAERRREAFLERCASARKRPKDCPESTPASQ